MQTTLTIDANKINLFLKRVVAMQNKAAKLGFDPIVLVSVGDPIEREVALSRDEFAKTGVASILVSEVQVVLEGTLPVFNGWTVLCRIDHTEDGNLVSGRTTALSTSEIREARPICQHCHQKRDRKKTYFIGTKTQIMQVGGHCLKDFTRSENPEREFNYAVELVSLLHDDEGIWLADPSQGRTGHDIKHVLAVTVAVVERDGYRSFAQAKYIGGQSTKEIVLANLDNGKFLATIDLDAYKVKAQEVIDWTFEQDDDSAYMHNAQVLLSNGMVSDRFVGVIIGLVPSYRRAQERAIREAYEATATNEWVGEVKIRMRDLTLRVQTLRVFENDFGSTTMFIMRDADGRTFKWMSSGSHGYFDIEQGDTLTLDGTVKKHEEYNGTKQTVLTRCKIKDVEATEAAKSLA